MPTQTIDRNIIFKEETIVSERVKYIMLEKNEKESWIQEVLIISSQIFKFGQHMLTKCIMSNLKIFFQD